VHCNQKEELSYVHNPEYFRNSVHKLYKDLQNKRSMKTETIMIPNEEIIKLKVSGKVIRMNVEEFKKKYGHIYKDVFAGKQIVLTKEEAKIFDRETLQSLSDIHAGRVTRVR